MVGILEIILKFAYNIYIAPYTDYINKCFLENDAAKCDYEFKGIVLMMVEIVTTIKVDISLKKYFLLDFYHINEKHGNIFPRNLKHCRL